MSDGTDGTDEADERRTARAARAEQHKEAQRQQKAKESEKAQVLIGDFLASARESSLATEELTARPWNGKGRYRTGVQGWFLRNDQSVGLGEDGSYYVLLVPPVRFGRLRTVDISPSPPPLIVGEGGRDGDAVALENLLAQRLRG